MSIDGHIDRFEGDHLVGWYRDSDNPEEPIVFDIFDGHRTILTVKADELRSDLLDAGIGTGRYGFQALLPKSAASFQTLRLLRRGSGIDLPGSPLILSPIQQDELGIEKALRDVQARLVLMERYLVEVSKRVDDLTETIAEGRLGNSVMDSSNCQPIAIGADEISIFALGFYEREFDDQRRPFRWTGNGPICELRYHLNRDIPWSFELELRVDDPSCLRYLNVFVDYCAISIETEPSTQRVTGIIPMRYCANQVVLSFYAPEVHFPRRIVSAASGQRSLSVLFYGLSLTPLLDQIAGTSDLNFERQQLARLGIDE